MVNSIDTTIGGLSGAQAQKKQPTVQSQNETDTRQKTASDAAAKQTEENLSTLQTEADQRVSALVEESLTKEAAQQEADSVKDALSSLTLSLANRKPEALLPLLSEAS